MLTCALLLAAALGTATAQDLRLPDLPDSVKLAVIGDNGTGKAPEYELGEEMAVLHDRFPYQTVLMLGDNMYGRQDRPQDFAEKFERPYAKLLADGVTFRATLGNHDDPDNRAYPLFGMNGERYYTYTVGGARFVVLDSNQLDRDQLAWFERTLAAATEPWKIVYLHHPLYSNGTRHGSDIELRVELEPLLVRYGVQVVLSGHDHNYERFKPQKGITYFVSGNGGQLRKGGVKPTADTAASFAADVSFMLIEITGNDLYFQTISRTGGTVDSGVIHRAPTT